MPLAWFMIKKEHPVHIPLQTCWLGIILQIWTFLWNNSRSFEYIKYSNLLGAETELKITGFETSYYTKHEVLESNILIILRISKETKPFLIL